MCCDYWIGLCRAYDRAAIKFRGLDADINFQLKDYEDDLKQVICLCKMCDAVFFQFFVLSCSSRGACVIDRSWLVSLCAPRWGIGLRRSLFTYSDVKALGLPGGAQSTVVWHYTSVVGGKLGWGSFSERSKQSWYLWSSSGIFSMR